MTGQISPALQARLKSLSLLAMDVDGVLTDGTLWLGPDGSEMKRFHVRDGLGLKLLSLAGTRIAWITARSSPAVRARASELACVHLIESSSDKLSALSRIADAIGVRLDSVGYIGDDLPDLPAMQAVSVAFAPADASALVRRAAHYVCSAAGGNGAVREVCDLLLMASGKLHAAVELYLAQE